MDNTPPTPLNPEKGSKIPSNLIKKFREGNVLAWVGAGMSQGAGYPSWSNLISKIADDIDGSKWEGKVLSPWVDKNTNSNPEWVAEILSHYSNNDYLKSLQKQFASVERGVQFP